MRSTCSLILVVILGLPPGYCAGTHQHPGCPLHTHSPIGTCAYHHQHPHPGAVADHPLAEFSDEDDGHDPLHSHSSPDDPFQLGFVHQQVSSLSGGSATLSFQLLAALAPNHGELAAEVLTTPVVLPLGCPLERPLYLTLRVLLI
jgi:hypothetical protein